MSDTRHGARSPLKMRLSPKLYWDMTLANIPVEMTIPINHYDYTIEEAKRMNRKINDKNQTKTTFDYSRYQELKEKNLNSDPCIVARFDFGHYTNMTSDSEIVSLNKWSGASAQELAISNFGLTGFDNGSIKTTIPYKDHDPLNKTILTTAIRETTLYIGDAYDDDGNDCKINTKNVHNLILRPVSGYTKQFDYTIRHVEDAFLKRYETMNGRSMVAELIGGFYQGFYKLDGYNYQTLPNRYANGFTVSTWLNHKPLLSNPNDAQMLNDLVVSGDDTQSNYGFFLYFGTRAENKFWTEAKSETDISFVTNISESEAEVKIGDEWKPIYEKKENLREIDNQFLIMGRANKKTNKDGLGIYNAYDFKGETPKVKVPQQYNEFEFSDNAFLLFGRSKGQKCCNRVSDGFGRYTVCDIKRMANEISEEENTELDDMNHAKDIVDNAVGFRITKDGKLGYRYVTLDSDGDIAVTQCYTKESVVPEDKWVNITLRWLPYNYIDPDKINDPCDKTPQRLGKLMVYINCELVHEFPDFPEYIGKRLDESSEKQLGVPYNISWGGGTQGLLENVTYNGQDVTDLGLVLERYFTGTFIGRLSQMKIYDCDMTWCHIREVCEIEGRRYGINAKEGYLAQENNAGVYNLLILLEDYGKIKLQ